MKDLFVDFIVKHEVKEANEMETVLNKVISTNDVKPVKVLNERKENLWEHRLLSDISRIQII